MPKPVALTADLVETPQIVPQAATPPRAARPAPASPQPAPEPEEAKVPVQVRWPKAEARAVKIAAAQADMTISDFMLACFHERMQRQG